MVSKTYDTAENVFILQHDALFELYLRRRRDAGEPGILPWKHQLDAGQSIVD